MQEHSLLVLLPSAGRADALLASTVLDPIHLLQELSVPQVIIVWGLLLTSKRAR